MKKFIRVARNWGPIVLLTLGTLWVLQGALAKTSSHGVIIAGGDYDAGTVKVGSVVKHAIRVINLSAQPVTVVAEPGCSCTVMDVPDSLIDSLHDEVVVAKIDTDGMAVGTQRKGVFLHLRSGTVSWDQLVIIGFQLN